MNITRNALIDMALTLPEDKLLKIFSFADFIKHQNENILALEKDTQTELQQIIENDEYYSEIEFEEMLRNK